MTTPDFTPLPDPQEPMDPHERGVRLIYILMLVCAAVLAYSVFQGWKQ